MHQCIGMFTKTIKKKKKNRFEYDSILFKFIYRNLTKISKSDLEVYAMFLPMAMFFYILFYVSMPFNEERTEFKKLQPISPFVYWTSVFLFDALIHGMYSYFMYTIHIWADTYHVFDEKEYGKFN